MLGFLKKLFGKPAEAPKAEAPYKVETPEVVVSVDPAVNPVVSTTNESVVVAETKPAKKQGGKKGGAPKKQAAPKKQGGSKPRKPKAPKA